MTVSFTTSCAPVFSNIIFANQPNPQPSTFYPTVFYNTTTAASSILSFNCSTVPSQSLPFNVNTSCNAVYNGLHAANSPSPLFGVYFIRGRYYDANLATYTARINLSLNCTSSPSSTTPITFTTKCTPSYNNFYPDGVGSLPSNLYFNKFDIYSNPASPTISTTSFAQINITCSTNFNDPFAPDFTDTISLLVIAFCFFAFVGGWSIGVKRQ